MVAIPLSAWVSSSDLPAKVMVELAVATSYGSQEVHFESQTEIQKHVAI